MRLTTFTDYSLRVMMYVALRDGLATIDGIAAAYDISRNHLMKVVFRLGQLGYLETVRGKGGGMRLARAPETIVIGTLVRQMEDDFGIVECFQTDGRFCRVEPACVLKGAIDEALTAFLAVLDKYTLADLIEPQRKLRRLLAIPAANVLPPSRGRRRSRN